MDPDQNFGPHKLSEPVIVDLESHEGDVTLRCFTSHVQVHQVPYGSMVVANQLVAFDIEKWLSSIGHGGQAPKEHSRDEAVDPPSWRRKGLQSLPRKENRI